MIKQVAEAGHKAGIPVCLCREMAGQNAALPMLIGLRIDSLSMNPASIQVIKQAITRLTMNRAEKLAACVMELDLPEEITNCWKIVFRI